MGKSRKANRYSERMRKKMCQWSSMCAAYSRILCLLIKTIYIGSSDPAFVQTAQHPWRSLSELGHHVPMSLLAYTNTRLCSSNRCLTSPAQWNSVPMPTEQRAQTRKINSSSWVIILSCETGKSTPSEIIKIKSEIISSKKRTRGYVESKH